MSSVNARGEFTPNPMFELALGAVRRQPVKTLAVGWDRVLARSSTMAANGVRKLRPLRRHILSATIATKTMTDQAIPLSFYDPEDDELDLAGAARCSSKYILAILGRMKGLRRLNLSLCINIGDDELVRVLDSCPKLQELSLQGCRRIGDVGMRALADKADCLTSIDLGGLFNISEAALAAGLEKLTGANEPTAGAGAAATATAPSAPTAPTATGGAAAAVGSAGSLRPGLKELHLSGCSIGDRSLAKLAPLLHPEIEAISLGYYTGSTGTLQRLADRFGSSLRRLRMQWNPSLANSTLMAIGHACKRLEVLDVTGCEAPDDGSLGAAVCLLYKTQGVFPQAPVPAAVRQQLTEAAERLLPTLHEPAADEPEAGTPTGPTGGYFRVLEARYTALTPSTAARLRESFPNLTINAGQ